MILVIGCVWNRICDDFIICDESGLDLSCCLWIGDESVGMNDSKETKNGG
jgi:hypothetical protein